MVSLRDPNSKVVVGDLQRSGDQKGHDLNHLGMFLQNIARLFPIGSMGLVYLPT